jgi:hypothetical protein
VGRQGPAASRGLRALEVLVDGAEALPRIHEAICNARSHVHIAGWHVTPGFSLVRPPGTRQPRLARRLELPVRPRRARRGGALRDAVA